MIMKVNFLQKQGKEIYLFQNIKYLKCTQIWGYHLCDAWFFLQLKVTIT